MFVCPSVDELMGCFYLLAIVNSAAITLLYKNLFESLLSVIWSISLAVALLSYGNFLFGFLWNHQTVFYSGWSFYISTSSCKKVAIFCLCQHLFSVLLVVAVLIGMGKIPHGGYDFYFHVN